MSALMEKNRVSADQKWKRDTQRILEFNHIARLMVEDSDQESKTEPEQPVKPSSESTPAISRPKPK